MSFCFRCLTGINQEGVKVMAFGVYRDAVGSKKQISVKGEILGLPWGLACTFYPTNPGKTLDTAAIAGEGGERKGYHDVRGTFGVWHVGRLTDGEDGIGRTLMGFCTSVKGLVLLRSIAEAMTYILVCESQGHMTPFWLGALAQKCFLCLVSALLSQRIRKRVVLYSFV